MIGAMAFDWEKYGYDLPAELIAKAPAQPRDSARLLIYDTKSGKISFDSFRRLGKYLPAGSFLVLNKTKVLPARIILRKETGGLVRVLFLLNEPARREEFKILADRKIKTGDRLYFGRRHWAVVSGQRENVFFVRLNFSEKILSGILRRKGRMPIPPYIKKTPLKEKDLRRQYQTIFAQEPGSVAAPTASLHFTDRVFRDLARQGIGKFFLTLHVGLGTFAPVRPENFSAKKLHEEYFEIDPQTVKGMAARRRKGEKAVAVGTTAVRALESFSGKRGLDKTDIFIMSGYEFKRTDALITNFHVPKSSLMLLVEAFLKFKKAEMGIIDLYAIAKKEKFRFYSFGDAMLIL